MSDIREAAAKIAEQDFRSDLAKEYNHNPDWHLHGQRIAKSIRALPIPYPDTVRDALDRYDAGLLGDGGGGDVDWWHDYIRAELERAHEFYHDQFESALRLTGGEG
jgi:hypothetical protein